MLTPLWSMITDESGSASLEYGILIAAIALVAIFSLEVFGRSVSGLFGPGSTAVNPWSH
ncbi:MAG TPA: Flp family type IVb pilin [Candidatus Cybelea sp.]|nr:Flp family type IVb pilin [Candidatus Cybelea sp.]